MVRTKPSINFPKSEFCPVFPSSRILPRTVRCQRSSFLPFFFFHPLFFFTCFQGESRTLDVRTLCSTFLLGIFLWYYLIKGLLLNRREYNSELYITRTYKTHSSFEIKRHFIVRVALMVPDIFIYWISRGKNSGKTSAVFLSEALVL